MKRNILIMAKRPEPGRVKTRLSPFLTDNQCAELALAMLKDTISLCEGFRAKVHIGFSPPASREFFASLTSSATYLIPQKGNDLGERMASIFEAVSEPSVMVGTDCPWIDSRTIEDAFVALDGSDAVFGPSTDGGYYLVGFNDFNPKAFENVSWSVNSTLAESIKNTEELGMSSKMLVKKLDIDNPEDLSRLVHQIDLINGDAVRRWVEQNIQLFQT